MTFALAMLVSLAGQSVAHAAHMAGMTAMQDMSASMAIGMADHQHHGHAMSTDTAGSKSTDTAASQERDPPQPCAWCDRAGGCAVFVAPPFTEVATPVARGSAPIRTDEATLRGRVGDFTERPPRLI
ncbi:hypothetical protein [Rubrimonas cliftonensis]|nr:hypothetical protein [Rubrimonas cliftonensis]